MDRPELLKPASIVPRYFAREGDATACGDQTVSRTVAGEETLSNKLSVSRKKVGRQIKLGKRGVDR